jgi:cytochrome c peroxidase
MHDGSLATLEDVIEFYSEGGRANPYLDAEIRPRSFTPEE